MPAILYKRKKPIPESKIKRVESLIQLFRKYNKVIIADFNEVPAGLLKKIRMAISDKAYPMVIKNKLAQKAIDEVKKEKKELELLEKYLTGMRMLIFTNDDVFDIVQTIAQFKEKVPPKPGKKSPFDIVIPKGGTGLKPGPAMTDLRVAGLPVRIIDGELFIMNDAVLVRKGQRLTAQAVKVMGILDISPFETELKIISAFDEGILIPAEVLLKPLEEYENELIEAINGARNISIWTALPVPEVIEDIVRMASSVAINASVDAGIITDSNAELILQKVHNIALSLVKEISEELGDKLPEDLKQLLEGITVTETAEKPKEEPVKEEKKEEKKAEEEEEAIGGLASLFG